jgi:hypothetical protein
MIEANYALKLPPARTVFVSLFLEDGVNAFVN